MKKQKVINELKSIAKKHKGVLRPEVVVEYARNKNNPLHNYFEWDDSVAGERYRLWQARQLIVSVEYEPSANKKPVNVFVSLTSDRQKGGYRLMEEVLDDKQYRSILLKDALNEMQLFQEKYKILSELVNVFTAMNAVIKKHNGKCRDRNINVKVSR